MDKCGILEPDEASTTNDSKQNGERKKSVMSVSEKRILQNGIIMASY